MKKRLLSLAKAVLFIALFFLLYTYSRDVLRDKVQSEALAISARKPNGSYDVILAGPSHIEYALQPAQLYGEYGIVSCNTATPAQSIPTTYYVIKEMIARHKPKLVVLDLFCLFCKDNYFAPSRLHQALDNFPLSPNKAEAVFDLTEKSRAEFFINYLLYHSRWKTLTEADYTALSSYNETYRLAAGTWPYPEPYAPVPSSEKAEIPAIPLRYLQKIVDLCKEKEVGLLLTVVPYRADIDNNDVSAVLQQEMFNMAEKYAEAWGVPYINGLHHLKEIGFDFTKDMIEYSHVNASGAEKVTAWYGAYMKEHFDLPDRRCEKKYAAWDEDYEEYLQALTEAKTAG